MRAAHPAAAVEVWAHDQARRGLKPIVRRVWSPRGQRPAARGRHRYQWTYAYGFVHPPSGRTEWLRLPYVDTATMGLALARFARAVGTGPAKRVVLAVDNAGWHTATALVVPDGLHLVFLPAHTPELQPAERLWPLLNEGLANREYADLAALEHRLDERCRQLIAQPTRVAAATHFHWWPDA